MRNGLRTQKKQVVEEIFADEVMDEQIFRFLAAFTQIEEENLRERLIKITEWMSRHPDEARTIVDDLAKH
ncbi:MAG TPA: hypothetical protein VIB38_11535 [Aestuariivirgaceae bacterium]|jgi:hypothetical protein